MTILDAIIEAVIHGLTVFLPVSAGGHRILMRHFMGIPIESMTFFSILLQFGSLLAIIIVYHKIIITLIIEVFSIFKDLFTGKFKFRNMSGERNLVFMLLISMIPLLIFYYIRDMFPAFANDNEIVVEGALFMVMGILLYIADRKYPGEKVAKNMHAGDALLVGTAQGLSVLPIISRTGTTVSTMIIRGYEKEFVVQFSFLMAIPAILGVNLTKVGTAMEQSAELPILPTLVGILVSIVVGILFIKFFQWIVVADHLNIFAYYTITLGCVVLVIGIIERILGGTLYELITGLVEAFT